MCSSEHASGEAGEAPQSAANREDRQMLANPLLLALALSVLVPVGSRIGGRGEGGTLLAVTLTVLAVIAGLVVLG
jgi:hypothetical protein